MISARRLRWLMNAWPPFLFTGIHITAISADFRHARVELRARWYTRNYVGTHFGGSLFAMTDPFWMLLAMHALGPEYIVWDKAATIEFVKPGRGTVFACFDLDDATLGDIRSNTPGGAKYLPWFTTAVTDASGDTVALIRKQIYVRRKRGSSTPD